MIPACATPIRCRFRSSTSNNPAGLNVGWGDGHITFSTTKAAFDQSKYWDYDDQLSNQNPGNNTPKFRSILSLLRP